MKSNTYVRKILIFSAGTLWLLVWLYSYYNPILLMKSILYLIIAPIYLFYELWSVFFEKKRVITKYFLIVMHIFMIISTSIIDENTFRSRLIVRKLIHSDISDIQRFIEFRENAKFDEYILFDSPFNITIFGISFRESYGTGNFDYQQCVDIDLNYEKIESIFDTTGLKIQFLPSYYLDNVNCNNLGSY